METQLTANVEITFEPTLRGFALAEFTDGMGEPCSLQQSSGGPVGSEENWVWLGCDRNCEPHHVTGETGKPRMFLSQSDVAALLPYLQRFADTGYLIEGK